MSQFKKVTLMKMLKKLRVGHMQNETDATNSVSWSLWGKLFDNKDNM